MQPSFNLITSKDTWAVTRGTIEDKPLVVRFREGLRTVVGHPQYPFQIGVAIPLIEPDIHGFPSGKEGEELNIIEDKLDESLKKDDKAVFALTITANGMREFVFYASEWKPEFFEKAVKSIDSGSHELQFMMQHDPTWDTFKKFVK